MPKVFVKDYNVEIDFPDAMGDDEINSILSKQYPSRQAAPQGTVGFFGDVPDSLSEVPGNIAKAGIRTIQKAGPGAGGALLEYAGHMADKYPTTIVNRPDLEPDSLLGEHAGYFTGPATRTVVPADDTLTRFAKIGGKAAREYWDEAANDPILKTKVDNFTDIKSVADGIRYGATGVGNLAGSMALIFGTGGMGGGAGGGTGAAGVALKEGVKRGLGGRMLKFLKPTRMDASIGWMEGGEIAGSQLEQYEKDGSELSLSRLVMTAVPAALVERGLGVEALAAKLGRMGPEARNFAKKHLVPRILQGMGVGGLGEGAEEFVQTYLENYGGNPKAVWTKETLYEALNAGLQGMAGGHIVGGVGGAGARRQYNDIQAQQKAQQGILVNPVDYNSPNAAMMIENRANVARHIEDYIAETDPALAKVWGEHATDAIGANKPIDMSMVTGSGMFDMEDFTGGPSVETPAENPVNAAPFELTQDDQERVEYKPFIDKLNSAIDAGQISREDLTGDVRSSMVESYGEGHPIVKAIDELAIKLNLPPGVKDGMDMVDKVLANEFGENSIIAKLSSGTGGGVIRGISDIDRAAQSFEQRFPQEERRSVAGITKRPGMPRPRSDGLLQPAPVKRLGGEPIAMPGEIARPSYSAKAEDPGAMALEQPGNITVLRSLYESLAQNNDQEQGITPLLLDSYVREGGVIPSNRPDLAMRYPQAVFEGKYTGAEQTAPATAPDQARTAEDDIPQTGDFYDFEFKSHPIRGPHKARFYVNKIYAMPDGTLVPLVDDFTNIRGEGLYPILKGSKLAGAKLVKAQEGMKAGFLPLEQEQVKEAPQQTAPPPKVKVKPAKTLLRNIIDMGGLSSAKVKAAGFNIKEDFQQHGLSFIFRKNGRSLDDVASELIGSGVILQGPESISPDSWVLQLLQEESQGKAATIARIEEEINNVDKEIQDVTMSLEETLRSAGYDEESIKRITAESERALLETGGALPERAGSQEVQEDVGERGAGRDETLDDTFVAEVEATEEINEAANEAATSPENDIPEPSEAQIEAGNYKKGHVEIQGLDISIENPKRSVRSGVSKEGKKWESELKAHYGYIRRTEGADGDHVDVFIGDDPASSRVFVVYQTDPSTGKFDEHKVMIGYNSIEEARAGYLENYEPGWKGLGNIVPMSMDSFKKWLERGSKSAKTPTEDNTLFDTGGMFTLSGNQPHEQKKMKAGEKKGERLFDVEKQDVDELKDRLSGEKAKREFEEGKAAAGYGTDNKIFTKDRADKAREILRKKLNQMNVGIDPEMLSAGIDLAGYYIEGGARKFADFSKQMVNDLGEKIRPFLKSFYLAVRNYPGMDKTGMETEQDIENYKEEEKQPAPKKKKAAATVPLKDVERVYIERQLTGKKKARDIGENQDVILTGGPPASGKSTTLEAEIEKKDKYVVVNADDVRRLAGKETDPGYHEEASRIANVLLQKTLKEGYHVIYDSQLTNLGKADSIIKQALENGGTADIFLLECDDPWATKIRTIVRYLVDQKKGQKKPRYVPDDPIIKGYEYSLPTFIELFERYRNNPSVGFKLVDNSVNMRDATPVFEKDIGGIYKIYDQALFDKLMNEGYNIYDEGKTAKARRSRPRFTASSLSSGWEAAYDAIQTISKEKHGIEISTREIQSFQRSYAPDNGTRSERQLEEPSANTTKETKEPGADNANRLADWVKTKLEAGNIFSRSELFSQAAVAFNGSMSEGTYNGKDIFDALELGINKYIDNRQAETVGVFSPFGASVEKAQENIDEIRKAIMDKIPSQSGLRSEEQDEFQQFSTPPDLAYTMAWVAKISKKDVVLEPSAGIGGIAVFGKMHAKTTIVNELSPRRAAILQEMGFDRVYTENAEQIYNILHKEIKPTVVLMNPPFSSTAGRVKGQRKSGNVIQHLDQALKLLQPNGRMVALIGKGWFADPKVVTDYFQKLRDNYNLRAIITIGGKGYAKYGTTYDNRILVIDKTVPENKTTIQATVEDVRDAIPLLREIKDARATIIEQQSAEPEGERISPAGEGTARPVSPVLPSTGIVGGGERTPGGLPSGGKPETNAPVETGKSNEPSGKVKPSEPPGTFQPGEWPEGTERPRVGGTRQASRDIDAEPRVDEAAEPGLIVETKTRERSKEELSDSVYESYTPQKVSIVNAKPHPGKLVESAAMSMVDPPDPTYSPKIPESVIKTGQLSLAQLESIVYAGQAHQEMLTTPVLDDNGKPTGIFYRKGYFIGDGTGVGKGREIAGILRDNYNQGRKKAIWISQNAPLIEDARRDIKGTGWKPDLIFDMSKAKLSNPLAAKEGIAFLGYDLLKSRDRKNDKISRLNQLVSWFGKDYDGVIVFDEAHNMGNALAVKGARGTSKPSAKALAGVELQQLLPNARVVYVSATGATEVMNLSYADRLGLWGEGTPFASKQDFVAQIAAGGIAAMEFVARDMKAMGNYLSRSLSYEDVKYDRLEHNLTPDQREVYDELATAWQGVLARINEALEATGGSHNKNARSATLSAFWGSLQRFFNQIITSMQTPAVVNAIEDDIKKGSAVVIQIVNTNEAAQERALAKMEEGDELEDLDLTPRDQLMQYVRNSFPVAQYQEVTDPNDPTKTIWIPVVDSNGAPVENPEAVAMREALLDKLGSIRVPDGPLEIILNHFGHEKVAEITGRTRRVITVDDEQGRHKVIEKRSQAKTMADADAFMGDKKSILVFSYAGGTGRSYHADLAAKNQRLRRHYLLQAGWRADRAIQGFGRTHRSSQAQAPEYILVTTDVIGQKRFISSIARRLDQLGALTKGQRETGSGGFFTARDNLESVYAQDAIARLIMDIYGHSVPGWDIGTFIQQTGLTRLVDPRDGSLNVDAIPPVTQFLNRLLAMNLDKQVDIFDLFSRRHDANIRAAMANGTLDVGLETLRAKKIQKTSEQIIHTDEKSGAQTKYVQLNVTRDAVHYKFNEVPLSWRGSGYYRNVKSGHVWAASASKTQTDTRTGGLSTVVRLRGPRGAVHEVTLEDLANTEKYEKLSDRQAKNLWGEEYSALPKEITYQEHFVTGALLPIWDRLSGKARIMRVQTDEGERLIGRLLDPKKLTETLRKLGATTEGKTYTPEDVFAKIKDQGFTVELSNGWKIKRAKVAGEYRIEIVGPDYRHIDELKRHGAFQERINWETRFFIPTSNEGVKTIKTIMANRPIVNEIAPLSTRENLGITPSFRKVTINGQVKKPYKAANLEKLLGPIISNVKKNTGVTVKVIQDNYGFPADFIERAGADFDIKNDKVYGAYDPMTSIIYLVADHAESTSAAEKTLFEELVGHRGLPAFLGEEKTAQLRTKVYSQFKGTPEMRKVIKDYGLNIMRAEDRQAAGNEFMIHNIDRPTIMAQVIAYVREALRRMGFKLRYSDADLRALVGSLMNKVEASMMGERRTGATSESGPVFRGQKPAPVFYSQLLNAVERKLNEMPAKAQSVIPWLTKNQVKPMELEEMGVQGWLNANENGGKIDKTRFAEWVKANQIQIQEIFKGDEQKMSDRNALAQDMFQKDYDDLTDEEKQDVITEWHIEEFQMEGEWREGPRHSRWVLPGGQNYREMLFVLPQKRTGRSFLSVYNWEDVSKKIRASLPSNVFAPAGSGVGKAPPMGNKDIISQENKPVNPDEKPSSSKTKASDINRAFADRLDKYFRGEMGRDVDIVVMDTPVILTRLGAKQLPVTMNDDVIRKVMHGRHVVSLDALKNLPEALNDPIAVFDSSDPRIPNALVVMTNLKDQNGDTIIVAVHLSKKIYHHDVNKIASLYGKEDKKWFDREVGQGRLRYINREKAIEWSQLTGQLFLPSQATIQGSMGSILTEKDFVKGEPERPSFSKTKSVDPFLDALSTKNPELAKKLQGVFAGIERQNRSKEPLGTPTKEIPDPVNDNIQKTSSWLNRETAAIFRTIAGGIPGNMPHNSFLENVLKSPEWYEHPVMKNIVRLFTMDRERLYHTTMLDLSTIDDQSVIEETDRLRKKNPQAYKELLFAIDYGDTRWKRGEASMNRLKDPNISEEARAAVVANQVKKYETYLREKRGVSDEAIRVWKLHRASYDKALDMMTAQLRALVAQMEEGEATGQAKTVLKELRFALASMQEWRGFYAPRLRERASWAVQAEKTAGDKTERYREHKSKYAAERLADKLREEGWKNVTVTEISKLPESVYQNLKAVDVAKAIKDASAGMKGQAAIAFNDELIEHVSNLIKSRGFRSSMIHRGSPEDMGVVKGYMEDPLERYTTYVNNLAGGLSKAQVAQRAMQQLLGERDEDGNLQGGIDAKNENRVYVTAERYIAEQLRNLDHTDRIVGIAKSVATLKYLGFNPRSMLVNMTAMVTTVPASIHQYVMGGKGSMIKVLEEITKAGADIATVMAGRKLKDADEQAFIDRIRREGYDDPQLTRDAMGKIGKIHKRAWSKIMSAAMWMFGKTEQWNRMSTMLAGYRLARAAGKTAAQAHDMALDASNKAHGLYGRATLPAWAQGGNPAAKVGQMLYVYGKFGHNYLQMMYDLGAKKRDIKALLWGFASPIVLAGGTVWPLKDLMLGMIEAIRKLFGFKGSAEKYVYDGIRQHLGKKAELGARHGLTGLAGIDISGSLSIGVGIPKNMWELTGAVGGVYDDAAKAVHYLATGQPMRAFEKALPTGLANPMRAAREATRGVTSGTGRPMFDDETGRPLKLNAGQTALRAAGFRPSEQAVMMERKQEHNTLVKGFTDRRDNIYEEARAYFSDPDRDTTGLTRLMKKQSEYNQSIRDADLVGIVPFMKYSSLKDQARRMIKADKRERMRFQKTR